MPLPDWKRDELRRRKERFLQNTASGRTWEEVKLREQTQHDCAHRLRLLLCLFHRAAAALESISLPVCRP
jgi:hypothetical protein